MGCHQHVTAVLGGKRKAVGECSTAPAAKQRATGANLFNKLMGHLQKDTLQNICEDLDVPVSGSKDELISRIYRASLRSCADRARAPAREPSQGASLACCWTAGPRDTYK